MGSRLAGKVALITGAASGIGLATARLFAAEGARVAIADLDGPGIEAAADGIAASGGEVIAISGDVSLSIDVSRMVETAIARFGRLDILYNNAGIMKPGLIHEVSEADWDRTLAVNLKSVFLGCKYALPELMKHGGVILSTASVAGLEGRSGHGHYCASKAGIINLTRNIAMDYAKYGIRANCICPGGVATNISKDMLDHLSPEALQRLARWTMETNPIPRISQPEEIARVALFLCSDDASYVTGHAMVVDGGSIAGHSIPLVE